MRYILLFIMIVQPPSFKDTQLTHGRVKVAYDEKEATIKRYFVAKGLQYEKFSLFIRAFKKEQSLEVWIKEKGSETFTLLHTYEFCSTSGTLGPKRKEGDLQIPEGVYSINHFNPLSNFHLSLGINYPNKSDKVLSDARAPGGAIYIHGNCVTVGCIPITDEKIKELYILAVEARNNGQQHIPVHIFPAKLEDSSLEELTKQHPYHKSFWQNLQIVYKDFERLKNVRPVQINGKGEYFFKESV